MQGYIYVEHEEALHNKYQPRYFILFPFCGLRWFLEQPEEIAVSKLLMSGSEGGWVFGGNIRVNAVNVEPPTSHNLTIETPIYPFVLELVSPDRAYILRLGCDDDSIRQNWIDEIMKTMHIQHYLYSCVECGAVPSKTVFCAALAGQTSVILENINMTVPSLGSLVMVCKLNQTHGSILQALHLENTQLSDIHVPLLCSLLTFSTTLQSLSLANNYITCKGVSELSEMLVNCSRLILLDLSSNFIADEGVGALAMALTKTKKLSHLDLSRNRLTCDGAKLLAFCIAGYDSLLTSLNLSFNRMGDAAASLIALLLTNDPSKIENVDLSYCGIQPVGLKELAHSLIGCKSLRNLVLTGNQGDENSVALLMDALSCHQRKFGISTPIDQGAGVTVIAHKVELLNPDRSALSLHLGGLLLENMPLMLTHKTMRHAMAYACQQSSIPRAILQRRVAHVESLQDNTEVETRISSAQHLSKFASHGGAQVSKTSVHVKASNWICLRVQLVQHMESIYDVIESLALIFKADPRQLQLLSCTDMDEIDACFMILTPVDPEDESVQGSFVQLHRASVRPSKATIASTHKKPVLERVVSTPQLPSALSILEMLQEHARVSSPSLRRIGIRTVFIQQFDPNVSKRPTTFHCHIKGGGSGGDGILAEYIPPLFPMASVLDNIDETADDDDAEDDLPNPVTQNDPVRASGFDEEERRDSLWYHEDDEDEDGEGEWKDAGGADMQYLEGEVGDVMVFDSAALSMHEATENMDSKIILAIRQLQQNGEIPMDAGAFWQQAFNGSGDVLADVKADSLDENGMLNSVGIRKRLCDAMLERNTEDMSTYLTYMKAHNVVGGKALRLGEQLLSEITALRRDAANLESLAQKPEDMNIVETFLMACGRMGYSGKETIMAVELREYLVRWALQDDPEYYKELEGIKQRSLVTNIMISRDLTLLRTTLDAHDAKLLPREQKQIAMQLLDDCDAVKEKLFKALEAGSLEHLEDCIAEAAYLNIYDDDVDRAVEIMLDLGGNGEVILNALLQSLRVGSKSDLETALSELRRVGWDHPFIHDSSQKIFHERNRVVQEDVAKRKILSVSNDIKNGYEVKNIEIMQLLRGVAGLGLNQNPGLQPHIQVLEKYLKRMAGLASQEEEILRLIDDKDLDKLTDVLSGRGTGRLVMSAPSAEVMKEWIDALQLACKIGKNSDGNEPSVYKAGLLEKAARGKEGGLRNWRQRYFVLDKLSISYYTKVGGEKKGNVRVGGGAIRLLSGSEDTGGRPFCFELQEGRDLSIIDPDLLFEARRQVNIMHQDKLEEILAVAVAEESEEKCASVLDRAAELDIELHPELTAQARLILLRMQHRMLKVELHNACRTIPRGQLPELLRAAKRSRLDPTYPMFKTAQLLCEKPESELSIIRARGCLLNIDESAFNRSLSSVQRFDVKRLGGKEKTVLVAVLLQHCGMQMARALQIDGELPSNAVKIIQQTLDGCMQYFVETEPMQLARNIILSYSKGDLVSSENTMVSRTHGSGPLMQLKRMHSKLDAVSSTAGDFGGRSGGGQFQFQKFPNVRPVEALAKTNFLGRRKTTISDANSVFCFQSDVIQTSLLTLPKNESDTAVEIFKALLVVMGDKPLQLIASSRLFSSTSDSDALALALINIGQNNPLLRDELYIQLCKQLSRNPKESSRARGLSLLATYLHTFPPSTAFFPFVRSFLVQCVHEISTGNRKSEVSGEYSGALSSLTRYALKSASWCENEMDDSNGFRSDVSMVDTALMRDVINRTPISVSVGLMTGSVHNIRICFGDIDTSFSLVSLIMEEILGLGYSEATTLKSLPDGCLAPYSKPPTKAAPVLERSISQIAIGSSAVTPRLDLAMKLFRGFCLYESDGIGGIIDLQSIPVQPDEDSVLQWQTDFLWDLVQNYSTSNTPRQLLLRRRLLLCSEDLFDQIDVFRDMAIDRDTLGTKRLWSNWLRDESNGLPIDHVRIDMLFAEESRYVNSRLYAMSEDAYAYLTALQMTLSWCDRVSTIKWGSGVEGVMHSVDGSVRPSMKKSSYQSPYTVTRSMQPRITLMGSMDRLEHRGSVMSLMRARTGSAVDENVSDEEDEEEEDNCSDIISWTGDPVRGDDLSPEDFAFMEEKLTQLGIAHSPDIIVDIANEMYSFHEMARHMNVSILSQRFRYMMKTAYLTYVMAWPLAGGHFAEALFDKDGSKNNLAKVLICISGNGIYLLTADEWALVFHAPIYDIQSCDVSSASEYSESSTESLLLRLVVNEMPILLVTPSARDVKSLLEAFNTELLYTGAFPHGLEGGNDILDIGESFTHASEMKAVMRRFVKTFPMFPTPPVPLPLSLANSYFDPPKSRRAILAEERAEEERLEQEQARLAAETHAAKNMAHLEHGKQTLQQFMSDDDDDDDDKVETSSQGGKVKSRRRKRNTLLNMRENIDQQLPSMIISAVCGVSSRPPLVKIEVPPQPIRGAGLRLDTMFAGENLEKPPLLSTSFADFEAPPEVRVDTYRPIRSNMKGVHYPISIQWIAEPEVEDEVIDEDGDMHFQWLRGQEYTEDRDEASYHPTNYYSSLLGFSWQPPEELDDREDELHRNRNAMSVSLFKRQDNDAGNDVVERESLSSLHSGEEEEGSVGEEKLDYIEDK